ncbi:MAG: FtsX-like permease family protein [Bacteroidales bacterium]|jgi:putative ABC transport system permease protein|nr:FtsX-like permease family protein [Bacteroidales bacterium]
MLKNYLIVFFRNTFKNPFYSAINISGLAIGLACSIVAFLYIINESSINKGFDDYDKIYRIGTGIQSEMINDSMSTSLQTIAPALKEQIPEIVAATRFLTWYRNSLIKVNNEYYPHIHGVIADSAMLDVFSFKILKGNPETFLKSPTKVAISKSLANKLFKDIDPIQQMIHFQGEDLEVSWILEDSKNSMITYDLIASYDFKKSLKNDLSVDVHTFFKTREKLTPQVESKIRKVSDQIILERFDDYTDLTNSPIQPLSDLYLNSYFDYEIGRTGSIKSLYIFGFLALIILTIAVINYINLLTSRSEYRNKEVGIRKVVGADKAKLKLQFLGESVMLSFIALLLGFVLAELFIYYINDKLFLNLSLFGQSTLWIFLLYFLVSILIGIIAGLYPSFVLSAYSPLKVIKGIFDAQGNRNFLKILLVVIQFTISTILIIAIFIFNSQIKYLKNKPLGFNEENLLILSGCTQKINQSYESIRQDLLSYHLIDNVSASQSVPGDGRSGQSIRKKTDAPDQASFIAENRVQDFYTETMDIEIVEGRSFHPDFDDDRSILINESAAKLLKVDNLVGLEVVTNRESIIIGIVKDYHFYSPTEKLDALYLSNYRKTFNNLVIRILPDNKLETIQYIRETIKKYDPDYYWSYFFMKDRFENMYRSEERLFDLIFWGSGIAIILSILGLFALTSYTVSKRFREIGIRKTFGASINSIVSKLNKDIIRWVLLTNIIAWPTAYFIMENWLQNYPYRIEISWIFFVLASIISLLIAFLTISFQAYKAARMNPVDAIRYE